MNILAFHRQQKVVKCDTIAADGTQLGCGTQHGTCLRYELMIFTILASTMLLRLMRTFSAVLAVSASLCIVSLAQAFNGDRGGDEDITTPKPFIFNLQQSCDNWVVFAWDSPKDGTPYSFGPPHFSSCEITYMNKRSQVAKLVMVILHPEIKTIRLSNLNRSTHYAASMTCNETLTSNTVQFVTGYPCSKADVKKAQSRLKHKLEKNDTAVFRHPVTVTTASSGYSVTDMVLGLFFALCGLTIAGCFAYYYWKKRRHRQRILRIFGQSHSDPFLALHTPSDQPTTAF